MKTARRVGILTLAFCFVGGAMASGVGGDDWSGGYDTAAAEYALTAGGDEPGRGTILFEYYWGTDGSVSSLEGLPTFPNYPDDREWRTSLEGPTDWRDNYGTYVRGYLHPPGTGNYTFWIASDDQSQLWLSTDEDPAHIVQIASVPEWTPSRDFGKDRLQKSRLIPLVAGKRYYIEVLQAEGIGGDNLAVAWQGPGIRDRTVITGKYLSPITGPQDVTDPNLLGWWKLDETSGTTAADSSGNGHDGAIQGTPTRVDGPPGFGKALYYNGQNPVAGWVNCGTWNPSAATGQLTVTFWAKWAGPVGPNNWQGVVGKRNDWDSTGANQMWEFEIDATSNAISFFRGGSHPNCGGRILPIGEWTHVTATFDGATLVFFIDGQETGRGAFSFGPTTDAVITIGCDNSSGWNSFNGALDDVRIYDRALLPGEIRWLTGLFEGEYFANMTLSGGPALTRLDPEINFNWGVGEVFPGVWDNCSVRWTGEIAPAFTEPYTFYVNTDDGARLWLDDDLIIDAWQDQAATEYASAPIQLAAGQRYSIRLEWYENTGEAVCELRWSSPSTPKQVISSGRLHPPGASPGGSPSITLDPTNGPVGTTINVCGSGFSANTVGDVIFAGASKSVTTSPTGTFSTTMTVPSVSEGDYPVQADIPSGGATEASATFTITTSGTAGTLNVDPGIGHVKDTITVAGNGFSASTAGRVFFDTNRNYTYDSGEPVQSLTTSPTGALSTTLTVPTVTPGDYPVLADFPIGGSAEGTATFSVVAIPIGMGPYLSVVPYSGSSGTYIRILGGRFASGASGRVFFDSNRNGSYDSGEPMQGVSSLGGSLSASLTVPSVSIGSYSIRADVPLGGSVEASSTFTVTVPAPTLTLDRTSGGYYNAHRSLMITGKGFAPNATGDIWFDTNGDGLHEDSESDVSATTSSTGELLGPYGLYIPNVPGGIYAIWADIPRGGRVETSAAFTVIPSINVSPTISIVGSEQFVAVGGLAANTAGRVFWDRDNDNAYDVGEPVQSPITRDDGSASTSLIVPNVAPGDYKIVGEFPIGGPVVSTPVTVFAATRPLTVTPTSGTWGADFRAYVVLPVNSEYIVFFDTDRDNTYDEGEPSRSGIMSSGGVRVSTLQVPGVQAGAYSVLLQSPFGGPIVDSATFTVVAATSMSMTVTPTTGSTRTVIDCRVVGVPANTSRRVFFDIDRDNTWDPGEPNESGTTGNMGGCYVKLVAPAVQMGDYPIRFDCPIGGPIEASATFTLIPAPANPVVTISPTSGPVGTRITIQGNGFGVRVQYMVFFDRDRDGVWDEPYSSSTTDAGSGGFQESLIVPSVAPGNYPVQIDLPKGGPIEKSLTFTVTPPTPSITVSPTSGRYPDEIMIWGSGFAAFISGNVTLAGSSKSVITASDGTFEKIMTVPDVAAGTYAVQADIPSGGSVEASASFTVTAPIPASITVSPTSGHYGDQITIAGSDFAASVSGNVTIAGYSKSVTTLSDGTFSTTMSVPDVAAGTYSVEADIPSGGSVEASATFTVAVVRQMTLSPTHGDAGTDVSADGTGFWPNTAGRIFVDLNSNGRYDSGEPAQSLTTSSKGSFSISLTVPAGTPAGEYQILLDCPIGSPIEASATFTVGPPASTASITASPTSGHHTMKITVTGSGFAPSISGEVKLAGSSKSVTTSSDGTFSTIISVPDVAAGDYPILADIPLGGSVEAHTPFTVTTPPPTPSITLSPASGRYPQTITITGSGFAASTSGKVIFAGDSKSVTTSSDGTFSTTMRVPLVGTGVYSVQADIPSGGSVEASAIFIVN